MSRCVSLLVILVCFTGTILLGSALSPSASVAQTPKENAEWEYTVKQGDMSQSALNQLGNQGWELVAIEPKLPYVEVSTVFDKVRGSTNYTRRVFYFKRLKQ
jgi:hypothetical protein